MKESLGFKKIFPVIVSASRVTDIPAFYTDWFLKSLEKGYIIWKNPFNGDKFYLSFNKTSLIVFWSKDPLPLIPYLKFIEKKNIDYYFHFTLNDYEKEGFEPGLKSLKKRIEIFKRLSDTVGREKIIWRFDPLIITKQISREMLVERVEKIARKISPYTNKLVFSYIDLYRKTIIKFKKKGIILNEIGIDDKLYLAKKIFDISKEYNLEVGVCAEEIDLKDVGIERNRCIDPFLMIKLFKKNQNLMDFIGYDESKGSESIDLKKLKDKGQRKWCGCIKSKDIGTYNTCKYSCLYCYSTF